MSFNLTIIQSPLSVTPTHADHTWNIGMNDWSAFTDIRLVVDVYKNPYQNDSGSTQDYGKVSRLLVPVNQYGNCIFNVEQIIYNLTDKNPRGMGMVYTSGGGTAQVNPFNVEVAQSNGTSITANTSNANITNATFSTIAYSNGMNGGVPGFGNIYHINEYRLLFGVQYTISNSGTTSGATTEIIVPTNFSAYTGNTGSTISIYDASTQPYGVMIWPGVQENKQMSQKYYYSANNLTGQYNYLNTKVYDYKMDLSGGSPSQFMSTYGSGTIPMTILGSQVYQTRYRTHYYKCPILVGFMYGNNPLFNNSTSIGGINYLQKTQGNGQYNYDTIQSLPIDFTSGATHYSYLSQRIAYGLFKTNPNIRTGSDVSIFLSNGCNNINYNTQGVSEIVQYKMVGDECFNNPTYFLFMNRQGIWDTYTFTKKYSKTWNLNKKVYSRQKSLNTTLWNRESYDSSESVFYGDADEMVMVDSGYVLQNDRDVIEDLLMSPYLYMIQDDWIPSSNQSQIYPYLIPCTIQNKSVKQYEEKYQRIFQYTIELKQTPYRRFNLPF